MISRSTRPAYTLLEILLASTIALLLLAALYVSFDVVISQSDAGREEIDKNDLARAVVTRITIDIQGAVGPLPPKSGGGSQAAVAAAASTSQSDTSSDPTATGTAASATTPTSDGTGASDSDTATVANTGGDIPFGAGLVGNSSVMTLFVSRVSQSQLNPDLAVDGSQQTSDLRRISYYRGSHGGLCRQERSLVTSDGVWNSADADRSDEIGDLVAEEITDVQFQYFDGPTSSWVDSWDGTQLATDQKSLIGPPRAIKMTITIERPGTPTRKFAHVFPLRSATGLILVESVDDSTTTGSTTSGSTGGTSK